METRKRHSDCNVYLTVCALYVQYRLFQSFSKRTTRNRGVIETYVGREGAQTAQTYAIEQCARCLHKRFASPRLKCILGVHIDKFSFFFDTRIVGFRPAHDASCTRQRFGFVRSVSFGRTIRRPTKRLSRAIFGYPIRIQLGPLLLNGVGTPNRNRFRTLLVIVAV